MKKKKLSKQQLREKQKIEDNNFNKTSKVAFENKAYYFCSQKCYKYLTKQFTEVDMVPNVFSGNSIKKPMH